MFCRRFAKKLLLKKFFDFIIKPFAVKKRKPQSFCSRIAVLSEYLKLINSHSKFKCIVEFCKQILWHIYQQIQIFYRFICISEFCNFNGIFCISTKISEIVCVCCIGVITTGRRFCKFIIV